MTTQDPNKRQPNRRSLARGQADRAVRESEERYRALFESLDFIYLHDFEGRFLDANPAALELIGYDHEEILDLSLRSLLDDDQLAKALGILAEQKETGTQKTPSEFRLRRKTGEYVDVESKSSVIFRDGQPYAVLGVGRDITDRKQAEEALRESEKKFRLLVDHASEAIVVAQDGLLKFVNPATLELLGGYPEQDIIDRPLSGLIHPDDRSMVIENYRRRLAGEAVPPRYVLRVVAADGSVHWVEISAALTEWQGELATLNFLTDITERKQAEAALRESEARAQAMLGAIPDMVFRMDVQGVYLDYRADTADLYDQANETIIGKRNRDITPPEFADLIDQQIAITLETGAMQAFEYQMVIPGRGARDYEARMVPSGVDEVTAIVRDISERKTAEETLRQTEEHLRQSQKMEAVGQLAGGIAHDFNNLLTAILGYSDMILASGAPSLEEVRSDVEEIKLAGERASALTKQILAFSRRQALRPTVVSLNEVLAGMEPLLHRTLGENIDLVCVNNPDLGHVQADVHQFEQVIMNLALNARDAMVSGGRLTLETANVELGEQYCRTHPETRPGSYVMLSVSDTGVGMDEATCERVFEPFFTTKAPGQGTGLGLATVYGIVRQSNGSISVYSEPGKGTSFKIYLPLATRPGIPAEIVIPPRESARGSETVMVVEDEAALRGLIERILGGAGYTTHAFGSAVEALGALERGEYPIDLLLTDVVLSGALQGDDLARAVRAARPDLPVLFMSGYPRNAIVHAGRLDEGVNFLEKPFTPEALARTVRQVLDPSRPSG